MVTIDLHNRLKVVYTFFNVHSSSFSPRSVGEKTPLLGEMVRVRA